jgi:hypothetical protein
MVKNWISIFDETLEGAAGASIKKSMAWGISQVTVTELKSACDKAEAALDEGKKDESRTPVISTRIKITFEAMDTLARDIKRRHFFLPR